MRLIDAEAFFEVEFKRCGDFPLVGTCSKDNEYLGNRLSVAPTIEAKPVVHAHWVSASKKQGVNIGMKCSLCGARIKNSEFFNGNHNYCHKCGAQMDELVEDDKR